MKRLVLAALFLLVLVIAPTAQQPSGPAWSANISDIRRVATLIPGRKPQRINVLKFAESHRTKNFSVKGEPATPSVAASNKANERRKLRNEFFIVKANEL